MAKWNFAIQSSVPHDSSEIVVICCSRNISYYYECWKRLCLWQAILAFIHFQNMNSLYQQLHF